MKSKFNLKLTLLLLILSALLVAPAFGQGTSPPPNQPSGQAPSQPMGQPSGQGMTQPSGQAPSPGMAPGHRMAPSKGSPAEEKFKQRRLQMIKEMKLPPDKEKALLAVEDKYNGQRREIIDNLKKTKQDLQAALATANPDEAKVKNLVTSLTSGMDALFNSFKSQREEELAQLTPVEQGKYLMGLDKMREEMMGKAKKGKKK